MKLNLSVIPTAVVKQGMKSTQARVTFSNGYGASIISDGYGSCVGKYELAVTIDDEICYTTPITSDVLGYLTEQDVIDTCKLIADLPSIKE